QACLGAEPDPDPLLPITDTEGHVRPFPEPDETCDRERVRSEIAASVHQRGSDALLVVSTSTGISILGAAAYGRYVLAHPESPPLDQLAFGSVYLPSGLVSGRRATIDRMS